MAYDPFPPKLAIGKASLAADRFTWFACRIAQNRPFAWRRREKLGAVPFSPWLPELGKVMQGEMELWKGVIKDAHIKAK